MHPKLIVLRLSRDHTDSENAPGLDPITGKRKEKKKKELPRSSTRHIFHGVLRLDYFSKCGKLSQITMIPKKEKDSTLVTCNRRISPFLSLAILSEKFLLSKLQQYLHENEVIPSYQFGFRGEHKLIEQVRWLASEIRFGR